MGFYITEQAYMGDNGYSMRLFRMDRGYNDAALERCIVMHGAKYVSEEFIKSEKRLEEAGLPGCSGQSCKTNY
jgi:hypothetical protein